MIVAGAVSNLVHGTHLIDFQVAGQLVCVERSAATSRLREGDRVRVCLQSAADGERRPVMAFQRSGEEAVLPGPQFGFTLAILSGVLAATGLSAGLGLLLVPAAALAAFELLLSADRQALRAAFRRT